MSNVRGRDSQLGVLNIGAPPLEPHFFCSIIPPKTSDADAEADVDADIDMAVPLPLPPETGWGPSLVPLVSSPEPPPVALLMSEAKVDAVAGS